MPQVDAFEDMLFTDTLRGEDATGICAVNNMHGATVMKEATEARWFLYDKEYRKESGTFTKGTKALLGHNRKATMGGRKDEHAHPFVFDDRYAFFHNGTLHNHKSIEDTDVDSQALGGLFTRCEGDIEKLSEAVNKVWGAYACVWYDADKHTVYFLRNKERPLTFIYTEEGHIAYASESWMAQGALARRGMKPKEIKSLEVDVLYSIDLSNTILEVKEEKLTKKATKVVSSHHGVLPSNVVTMVTKREAKSYVSDLSKSYSIGVFPDEAVCCSQENPEPNECYDWLVFGSNENYEGVIFRFVIKDKFPWEVEELCAGMYVSGKYNQHEYKQGILNVWLKDVSWSKSLCH